MRTLTSRQRAFVAEFIANGGNATAAYRKEYPNTKGEKTASAQGARLKRHPLIAQQLLAAQIATERAVQIAVDRYQITAGRVADAMARLAFTDMRQVVDVVTTTAEDGKRRQEIRVKDFAAIDADAHQAIVEVKRSASGEITVRLADKRAAAMDLARLRGWVAEKAALPQQLVMLKVER